MSFSKIPCFGQKEALALDKMSFWVYNGQSGYGKVFDK